MLLRASFLSLCDLLRDSCVSPASPPTVEGRPRSQSTQDDGDAGREEDEAGAEDEDERKTTS